MTIYHEQASLFEVYLQKFISVASFSELQTDQNNATWSITVELTILCSEIKQWITVKPVSKPSNILPAISKRFIVKNTIEEKIIELQNKKQAVFEATVGKDTTSWGKLSAEDLKFLFTWIYWYDKKLINH